MSTALERSLQERLEAVRTRAERDANRTAEESHALLVSRARALARRVSLDDESVGDALDLLVVQVGDEQLAIPFDGIVAIARCGGIAPLPRAVRPVYGVTAWRGRPLTVLSLASTRPVSTSETRLVILGTGARASLAVVVDAVHDVVRITQSELTPASSGPRLAYALGVTSDGLLVVSGDALLHPDVLSV